MGHRSSSVGPSYLDGVGTDLALRAGLDPAWDAVLAVYLAGLARWPTPFQPRKPKRPTP